MTSTIPAFPFSSYYKFNASYNLSKFTSHLKAYKNISNLHKTSCSIFLCYGIHHFCFFLSISAQRPQQVLSTSFPASTQRLQYSSPLQITLMSFPLFCCPPRCPHLTFIALVNEWLKILYCVMPEIKSPASSFEMTTGCLFLVASCVLLPHFLLPLQITFMTNDAGNVLFARHFSF